MILLHLLLELSGVAITLATLPLGLELLVLSVAAAFPPRHPKTRASQSFRLAVIVPAHNEENLIAACVRSILADRETPAEVFVVAHNCSDRTAELALAAGARVLPLNGEGGKGLALDYGFRTALTLGADAVLVIDADSIVSKNLLATVAAALRGGAGAVQTRYQVANVEANFRTRLSALALLGMNVVRPRGRTRLGLSCGIFGNGFALSAATLARVPYTANSLVEDLEYHLRLIRAGIRVDFLDSTTVYGEMPENSKAASTQKARWEGGRALMRREWTLPLLRAIVSGKHRMMEPFCDLLALPLSRQMMLLVVALMLPITWLRVYAGFGLLIAVVYILVSAWLSPSPSATLKALAAAPAYLLWKVMLIPSTRLAARKDAAWIRTQRNAESDRPPTP